MDHSYLYSTRIEKSFDEDQAEILDIINHELAICSSLNVRLINYYKGLPISYPARIVAVEKGILDLDVLPHQLFTMLESRYTFIRSKALKHDVYATVQYANIKRRAVSLRKLCYVEILAEQRDYLRLDLDKQQNAMLFTNEGVIQGKLTELAINGACVKIEHPCSLEMDSEMTLSFMLHNRHQNLDYNVKTNARLVGIEGTSYPKYFRFFITPDKVLDRLLAQYLFQRQIEIIREIKDASEVYLNGGMA